MKLPEEVSAQAGTAAASAGGEVPATALEVIVACAHMARDAAKTDAFWLRAECASRWAGVLAPLRDTLLP